MNHAPQMAPCPGAQPLDALERFRRSPRGEPEARRQLIEALSPELVRALSPVIRGSVTWEMRRRAGAHRAVDQEVEDMVQTVLIALFTGEESALQVWDPDHRQGLGLESFVAIVAAREVQTHLRSRRRNPWTEEAVVAETFDQAAISGAGPETVTGSRHTLLAVASRLRTRVSALGFKVFELLFRQERSPEEVGAILGLRTPAVHTWRARVSRAAREIVTELEGERVPPPAPARRRSSRPPASGPG